MSPRVIEYKCEIDENSVSSFWQNRVKKGDTLKTCLLNETLTNNIINQRNNKEKNILLSYINQPQTILDIGCGIGRWAGNLEQCIKFYTGIDYTIGFIDIAKSKYNKSNYQFLSMSAENIDKTKLLNSYELTIITGVMMYINDKSIPKLLETINNLTQNIIYIQESVCTNGYCLTLNKHFSEALDDNYSAIYRQPSEYELFFKKYLIDFEIVEADKLLDETMQTNAETNAVYWIMKRRINDRK